MNKFKKSFKKIKLENLIKLLRSSPEEFFSELINSNVYSNNNYSAEQFWTAYNSLNKDEIVSLFPNSIPILKKVKGLNVFFQLNRFYGLEFEKERKKLQELKPTKEAFTKSIFLILDLGESQVLHGQEQTLPSYTVEVMTAAKQLLNEFSQQFKEQKGKGYSLEIFNCIAELLKIQMDKNLLNDFRDYYLWADLEVNENKTKGGFDLTLPKNENRKDNLVLLNELKTKWKRAYKAKEVQSLLSNEEHFKNVDLVFQTDKGMPVVYYTGNLEVKIETPGFTAKKIEGSKIPDMSSNDNEAASASLLPLLIEINMRVFHATLRTVLASIYQPNDNIDVHELQVNVGGDFFSLYEVFCAMSALTALGYNCGYLGQMDQSNIYARKNIFQQQIKSHYPEMATQDILAECDSFIVTNFTELEKDKDRAPYFLFEKKDILNVLKKIKNLKSRSDLSLEKLIHLFSDTASQLPYTVLYEVNGKYLINYTACLRFDLNRLLYDYYISEKIFNSKEKEGEEKLNADTYHSDREKQFNESICKLLEQIGAQTATIKFGKYDFDKLEGDIDSAGYFEKENLLITVQVKLSNVSPRSERRIAEWVTNDIKKKACVQVGKDLKRVSLEKGIELISSELGIKINKENLKIVPLVVTDNFFTDHRKYKAEDADVYFCCTSFFELEHLISGIKIYEKQDDWENLKENQSGLKLIELIEKNVFWSFLNSMIDDYTITNCTKSINAKGTMRMVI